MAEMIIQLGTYADLLAAVSVLGKPNAVFFQSVTGSTTLVVKYCGFAVKVADGTASAPNPSVVTGDFPDAVQVSLVSVT
jgi:hypothetical protein